MTSGNDAFPGAQLPLDRALMSSREENNYVDFEVAVWRPRCGHNRVV
jgi:hypothetical protein